MYPYRSVSEWRMEYTVLGVCFLHAAPIVDRHHLRYKRIAPALQAITKYIAGNESA